MTPEVEGDALTPDSPKPRCRAAPIITVCVWFYVAMLVAVWLLLRVSGDRWWFATLMLFGPRWICGLPLLFLVPAAILVKRRLLVALCVAATIVVGPLMGFCIPWARLAAPSGPTLRFLTCNVKGKCRNNDVLDELIATAMPDIVALQGCWSAPRIRWPAGWHVWKEGSVVVASRSPLLRRNLVQPWWQTEEWPRSDVLYCAVQTPLGEIDLCGVHLLSLHEGISAVIDPETVVRPSDGPILDAVIERRRQESEDASDWVNSLPGSFIMCGDFNMPVDSSIYRQYWAAFGNAFSEAGLGFGYTERPQVRGFSWGVRIDHILMGAQWRCRSCWTGPDIGSDHLPVLADLVLHISDAKR